MAMGGTDFGRTPRGGNALRLSGLVGLLPFMEQQALWEQISNPVEIDGRKYPAMGPAPWVSAYVPWRTAIPTLRCPTAASETTGYGQTNYTFCVGDMTEQIRRPKVIRGTFACGKVTRFEDILDGLANTIAMGEIGTPVSRSIQGQFATNQRDEILRQPSLCLDLKNEDLPTQYREDVSLGLGRGACWADGASGYSLINTILPPNSPSCAVGGRRAVDGVYTAGSFHQGGGHVLMADGAVVFMTDSVEAGDASFPPITLQQLEADTPAASPYGLWGALGTVASGEDMEDDLNR